MLIQKHSLSPSQSQHLQAELHAVCLQRDQAQMEADKWYRRYQVEAYQRRQDVEVAEATIQQLRDEIQQAARPAEPPVLALKPASNSELGATAGNDALPADQIQVRLSQALAERDQLAQALTAERASHAETRENLMNTLRDALQQQLHPPERPLSLPSSRPGIRAGTIIRKDRANRSSALN